jgi:16S rRNA (adenine1518-N6/adenine1519-N6)-dimethyltransferase
LNHQARKRFGQNFLQDQQVIAHIVQCIAPRADQHLVEIGPGLGAITGQLIDHCARLDAVELDRDLVDRLQKQFTQPHFHLHSADAMKFDFCSLAADAPLRVVGNLPYNISTPLIFHLLENRQCIQSMHFMLQKEVVDRLCASPGSKAYGRLSVVTQAVCETRSLFDIAPEAFDPVPKVMSSIVELLPRAQALVSSEHWDDFNRVVTAAFTHKRKTLRNNLKKLLDLDAAGNEIDLSRRAETLEIGEFEKLSQYLLS